MESLYDEGRADAAAADLVHAFSSAQAPADGFSVWFLGQNSFVLKGSDGFTVAVDPYLSDWCACRGKSVAPTPKSRRFPPPLRPEELSVDLVLLTHSHCDHADPETLAALAADPRVRVAGPRDAVRVAAEAGFPAERLRTVHAGEELVFVKKKGVLAAAERLRSGGTSEGLTVLGTFALPTDGTDLNHLGFLLRFASGATFWNTGDSAWCDLLPVLAGERVLSAASEWRHSPVEGPAGPDVMAVCINAGYGNLSHWDAARLAAAADPRIVVPTHWDLFPHNSLDPEPFRTSLAKNAPEAEYAPMERAVRYDYRGGVFAPAGELS